jgi:hypothetical protein
MILQAFVLIINTIAIGALAFWAYRAQVVTVKKYYWPALAVKVIAGLAVGWLYFVHYHQGDTIIYWKDAQAIAEMIMDNPSDAWDFYVQDDTEVQLAGSGANSKPRSMFFAKMAGIAALCCVGNYWIMACWFSLISFFGVWYLFARITSIFPASQRAAAIAFLFYPSVVFWSSGIIKESVGLGSLLFVSGLFLSVLRGLRISWWEWVVGILALWIGWTLKYYWMGVLLPVVITTIAVSYLKRMRPSLARFELVLWCSFFVVFLAIATGIHPNFYPHHFIEVIVQNNREFIVLSNPDNLVNYSNLDATAASVLLNTPQALIAGLFRPFAWEGHNLLALIAGFENLILLGAVASALVSLPKVFVSKHRLITFSVLTYILILAIFLALSTPNLGSLSRYKVGFLPFLAFISIYQNSIIERLTGKWV